MSPSTIKDYQGSGPVLWTYTGRKTLPPFTSLPVMDEIAGANTASLGGYLNSTKTGARWAEGFHEFNGHVFDLERDGRYFAQDSPCDDNTLPYRIGRRPGQQGPLSGHQDGGVKCATGA